jgi:predicted AlkP superfamily pyrophosphatase or phosphodiesterase
VDQAVELFKRSAKRGDELYVILTTDHGMMRVHTLVNVDKLFDTAPLKSMRIVTSGPMAQVYLDQVPATERGVVTERILRDLGRYNFVTAYTRQTLPAEWRFVHPTRTGDIVLMLQPGYTFNRSQPLATYPPRANDSTGMHGFPVAGCPEMRGFCAIWRYPTPLGGRDLGEVHVEQLHPTVAKLLNIHPSPQCEAKPLAIP